MDGRTNIFLIATLRWHSMQCGKTCEAKFATIVKCKKCSLEFKTMGLSITSLAVL